MCYKVKLCIVPCMACVVSGNGRSGRTVHILQCCVARSGHSLLNDEYKSHVTLCLDLRNSCNGHTAPLRVVTLLTTVFSLEEPIILIL